MALPTGTVGDGDPAIVFELPWESLRSSGEVLAPQAGLNLHTYMIAAASSIAIHTGSGYCEAASRERRGGAVCSCPARF